MLSLSQTIGFNGRIIVIMNWKGFGRKQPSQRTILALLEVTEGSHMKSVRIVSILAKMKTKQLPDTSSVKWYSTVGHWVMKTAAT
jgi:hypothetical protein